MDDKSRSQAELQPKAPQESRLVRIQRCVESMVHACLCQDASCMLENCHKKKRMWQHGRVCKQKATGGCHICKQLMALCRYHAKHCRENKCPLPFCLNMKLRLHQQQIQYRLQQILHRLQQAQLRRRRRAG